jgi:hypothetical protein
VLNFTAPLERDIDTFSISLVYDRLNRPQEALKNLYN